MINRGAGFLAVVLFVYSPTPLSPSPSVRSIRTTGDTQVKTEKERQLADGRGGEGVGEEQIIRWRESLVLYKSFNILWSEP
jgi:hypothetical protein